jgi:hypothetical protein
MPRIPVKGTDQTALVDAKYAKQLPKSIWVGRSLSRAKPMCRYEGKTMTLVRAIGLMAGRSPDCYILPKNGDHFDCRSRNAIASHDIPTDHLPVYKNSTTGIKGIRATKDGAYRVVLLVKGKQRQFGQSRDLNVAREILKAAQKLI